MVAPAGSNRDLRRLIPLGILGGWLLFTLMVIAISWTGSLLRGRPAGFSGLVLWNIGWVLWGAATFLVMRLTRRRPPERRRLGRWIGLHLGLAIAVSLGLLLIEFLFNAGLERLWPEAPRANAFLGYIVYKFHVYVLTYWLIVGATLAFDAQAQSRESRIRAAQLETQLAEAHLHALKAQLQPHFLFNTHHAIISLMLNADTPAAIRMLTRLSDLLRMTLQRTNQQVCPLREELEALGLYLAVQRERHGERLVVDHDIDPDANSAEVPWLILQPLVENALKHGIERIRGGGVLRIWARLEAGRLHLGVTDNGPGFPAGFDVDHAGGIGLRNTRARLARLYPGEHALHVTTRSPTGAAVEIIIPHRPSRPPASADAIERVHV